MILQRVTVSLLRSLLQNTNKFHIKRESVKYPRSIQGLWGKVVEKIFFQILSGQLLPTNISSYLESYDIIDDLLNKGVPKDYIYNFLTLELPKYIKKFIGPSHIPSLRQKQWYASFFEEKWYNIPELLIVSGKSDAFYQLEGIHKIIEVKSSLFKTPIWQIEDLVQITLYSYLCIIDNFDNIEQSYPLDIRSLLITGHYNLPIMKICYPPAGYIASYFDFSKIKAINHLLQQYIDYDSIDLTTYLPRSRTTLGKAIKDNWICIGNLSEVIS